MRNLQQEAVIPMDRILCEFSEGDWDDEQLMLKVREFLGYGKMLDDAQDGWFDDYLNDPDFKIFYLTRAEVEDERRIEKEDECIIRKIAAKNGISYNYAFLVFKNKMKMKEAKQLTFQGE